MTVGMTFPGDESHQGYQTMRTILVLAMLLVTVSSVDGFTSLDHRLGGNSFYSSRATTPCRFTSRTKLMMSRSDELVSKVAESVQVWTLDEELLSLDQILRQNGSTPMVLSCLSHFGDFNAWELTQQYVTALKSGGKFVDCSTRVVLVGIGSVASAQKFAQDLELNSLMDRLTLVADPEGSVTDALGCYKGWLAVDPVHRERYPQTDISPYFKLLGMIFGFGSPGTIEKVLYGYVGDTSGSKGVDGRLWVVDALLDGSSKGRFPILTSQAFERTPLSSSLRPFELATLRLQTGLHIVQNWGSLGPQKSSDLFTRMGGTFVLDANLKCRWSYFDQGILNYADIDVLYHVLRAVAEGEEYIPWTKGQIAALNQERQDAIVQKKGREKEEESDGNQDTTKENLFFARITSETKTSLSPEGVEQDEEGSNDFGAGIIEVLHEGTVEEEETEMEVATVEEKETEMEVATVEEEETEMEVATVEEETEMEVATEVGDMVVGPSYRDESARGGAELVQTKELFQRSLLQARLQYQPIVTVFPTKQGSFTSTETELFQRSLLKARVEYDATTGPELKERTGKIAKSGICSIEKELFQRNLLQAQCRYATLSRTKPTSRKEGDAWTETSVVNGATNPRIFLSEERKELFQRALLKARIRNE